MSNISPIIAQMQIISDNYLVARNLLTTVNYPFNEKINIYECTDIVFKVDKAFHSLNKKEQQIINKVFFKRAFTTSGFKQIDKEEYDALLKETIQHFLEVYYEIGR